MVIKHKPTMRQVWIEETVIQKISVYPQKICDYTWQRNSFNANLPGFCLVQSVG